jgi:predicted nucleic acid-binding Zn ribbon protein
MDEELLNKIEENSEKLDEIIDYIKRTKRFAFLRLVLIIILIVLPLMGIVIALPNLINIIESAIQIR